MVVHYAIEMMGMAVNILVKVSMEARSGEGEAYEALVVGDEVVARIAMGIGVTLGWRGGGASGYLPSWPLPDDYQDLCPDFILSDAEEDAYDFLLPEMVQAVFYVMVVNDALERDVLSRDLVEDLKLALVGLRWCTFVAWLQRNKNSLLRANCLGLSLQTLPLNLQRGLFSSSTVIFNLCLHPPVILAGTQADKDKDHRSFENPPIAHG
ncbi:hypothetical protein Cgig2_019226 [Carnegiea gigantea]|uniref:Uncharacterized protein n=1 Tax=Carnegiea gigantea TaxID=171969 RepID=A0A9Q1Q7Y4_9CARY|nr:hypothetical protein Cgig2_019226 [Carnegiea gigantea]